MANVNQVKDIHSCAVYKKCPTHATDDYRSQKPLKKKKKNQQQPALVRILLYALWQPHEDSHIYANKLFLLQKEFSFQKAAQRVFMHTFLIRQLK